MRVLDPSSHKWEPGIVKNKAQTLKSNVFDMSSGSTLKRNGRYIRLSVELDREPAGDNQSAESTATGTSFSSTISVPVSSSQAEETSNVQEKIYPCY